MLQETMADNGDATSDGISLVVKLGIFNEANPELIRNSAIFDSTSHPQPTVKSQDIHTGLSSS